MARAKGLAPLPDETSALPPKEMVAPLPRRSALPPKEKGRCASSKVGSASEAPRGESEKAPYGERDNFYFLLIKGDRVRLSVHGPCFTARQCSRDYKERVRENGKTPLWKTESNIINILF